MLSRNTPHIPKCCHHKATGQAFVKLNGIQKYLGLYGSATAKEKYDQIINQWLAQGRQFVDKPSDDTKAGLSIAEVLTAYLTHATSYYRRKDGTETKEVGCIKDAMRPLKALYGTLPAAEFSPLKLQAVREQMIRLGWARKTINSNTQRIKRIFRWACEKEMVPGAVYQAIAAVAGLRRGRSEAKEPPPVRPVADEFVDAIKPHVSAQVWAMIELQRLTGARPGEICTMRTQDINMAGATWIYTPGSHKTEYQGLAREIILGPRAQEIIRPFLKPGRLDAYLFSPQEAEASRNGKRRRSRKTDLTPSALRRRQRQRSQGDARDHYDVASYRRAIERGCEKAFPVSAALGKQMVTPAGAERPQLETLAEWWMRLTNEQKAQVQAWRKAHYWHPHQLRHSAATAIRREFGIEVARVILGHHSVGVTEIYAEQDREKAQTAMLKIG